MTGKSSPAQPGFRLSQASPGVVVLVVVAAVLALGILAPSRAKDATGATPLPSAVALAAVVAPGSPVGPRHEEVRPALNVVSPIPAPGVPRKPVPGDSPTPPRDSDSIVPTVRPNIVVIMVDDLAAIEDHRIWDRMPTIHRLFVEQGLQFVNYFGDTPLCCPGRVNFLTGLRTEHHGVWFNDARLFHADESLATELHDVGYYTFISGKYLNLTNRLSTKWPPGWDHASIFAGAYYDYQSWKDGVVEDHGALPADYSTDVFADDAVQLLDRAPPDRPVFAFLTPFATHSGADRAGNVTPHMPVPADRFVGDPRCADLAGFLTPSTNEADVSDKPGYIARRPTLSLATNGWPLIRDCEALLSVDAEVAAITSTLARQGRLDNTLFILTADNGMSYGRHRWAEKRTPYASQIDFFVHWTDGIGTSPGIIDALASNIDVAPTLCQLAGCVMGPYPTGQVTPDGVSFLPVLMARGGTGRDYAVEEDVSVSPRSRPQFYGLRSAPSTPIGAWHYVAYDDGEYELYDLAGDPDELQNLAGNPAYAGIRAFMGNELAIQRGLVPVPAVSPTSSPARQ